MPSNRINRRQFIRLSALSGSAALLAACGANTAPRPTPVPTEDTASSAASSGASASSSAGAEDVQVMVSDVLDYALSTDEWTGQYGWVKFKMHEGRYNGDTIYYIRTDASDSAYAEEIGLVYVPLLNAGASVASSMYVFNNDAPAVFGSSPSDPESYISLYQVKNVTVNDNSVTLDSVEAVEKAAEDGSVAIEETSVYVNYPVVKWAGGQLPVDTSLTDTLGEGPLTEEIDTNDMTITFKLHECYPGSRYIITDTSAVPMAPMMGIVGSAPTQQLMDLGATDEIWVFANGIEGSGVMGFQPAIFDNKAGDAAWSPMWNHFTLRWNDGVEPRLLTSSAEIREALEAGELEEFNGVPDTHPNGFVVNCPAPILAPTTFTA